MSGAFFRDSRGVSSRVANIKTSAAKTYSQDLLSGDGASFENIVEHRGKLCAASLPTLYFESVAASDERVMTASVSEGNVELIRVGDALYGKASGSPVLIADDLFVDDRTVIHRMNGAFYIITGMTIYKVNDSLGLSTVTPHVPMLYKSYQISAPEPTPFYEEPNALSDLVDLNYAVGSSTTTTIALPDSINVSSITSVKTGTTEYQHPYSLVSGGTKKKAVSFPDGIKGNVTIRLRLSSTATDGSLSLADFKQVRDGFLRARYTVPYYSLGDDYSLVLGTCGYDKKYYVVGISDMAYITTDSVASVYIEQTPTAALAYGDGTLVLTKNRILSVSVTGGGVISDGVNFDVSVIKRDFGCDAPRTAVGFDDKIFFLSSSFGVYYMNKFGYTERDGACPISLPIKSDLTAHTEEELKAAVAGCTGNALCISVGEDTYLYKFSNGLPSSPDESEKEQSGYIWSKLGELKVNGFLSSKGSNFYYLESETGSVCIFDADGVCEDGDGVNSAYTTPESDLGCRDEKVLDFVELSAKFENEATVTIFYDGLPDGYETSLPPLDASAVSTYKIRAPKKRFESVSVSITDTGSVEIDGLAFSYRQTRI